MKGENEIVLKRKLRSETFNLLMTVSKFEAQDEIIAILKLFEQYGSITQEVLNTELLHVPPDSQYGKNVLKVVESYGLITGIPKGRFELTETGEEALSLRKIPVPKRGVFNVILSKDPLLPVDVVDITDTDKSDFSGYTKRDITRLPDEFLKKLESWSGRPIELPARNMMSAIVHNYSEQGIKNNFPHDFTISLRLMEKKDPELHFSGSSDIQLSAPKNLGYLSTMEEILNSEGKLTIIGDSPTLLVKADKLTILEMTQFEKNFKIDNPTLEKYGKFDPTEIWGFRIFPSDVSEAMKWGWKILIESIDKFIEPEQYEELVEEISRKFEPRYSADTIYRSLPTYERAIEGATSGDKKYNSAYWYLLAPFDLSPRRGKN